ncbi:MAG TPA: MoxR family ATPase [Candidatus Limnocylindria bacterium]|nr:MoxR family ATPase [Candidatus Limnocylindria bacterium]
MTQQTLEAKPAELSVEAFADRARAIEAEVKSVIVGQDALVRQTLICLIANGHALLEGVPGLGKTMLVKTVADVIDCSFNRIQFTPDLMPADIVGTNILVEEGGQRQFRFQQGPVFANLLLADEINRATPKTQSALLEAMQEQQVSVARERHKLEPPFFVLATQNPLEMEGTYPLPEAQLDRFLFKLWVAFPSEEDLIEIMERTTGAKMPTAGKAANAAEIVEMQRLARSVPIAPHVTAYAVSILAATHPDAPRAPELVKEYVRYGGSPRGAQALVLTGKIHALLEGRYNVAVEDIRAVAMPALRHRVIRNFEGEAEGITSDAIVRAVLDAVPPPSVD